MHVPCITKHKKEVNLKHIIAENYLCFYAVLEMILSDIGINGFSQYNLANEFGVVLPFEHSIPNVYNVSFSNDIRSQGAHINEDKINRFFGTHRMNLKISYIPENPYIDYGYDTYGNFIPSNRKYYIYSFSYGSLYNEVVNYKVGHVSLLISCPSLGQLEIYDPGPRMAGIKVIKRIAMHDAMEDIRGGVYMIERVDK